MIHQKFTDIYTDELAKDAILNEEYIGFKEDYLVLHCLLRKYQKDLKRFLEIGTNMGTGTKIIKNAVGSDCIVMSLDLPSEMCHMSLQHPISEGKGDRVGSYCDLPFIQLREDSLKFDYTTIYPIDGWYIDGEHDYEHPFYESKEAFKSNAKIIMWHDSDIDSVYNGISDAFKLFTDRYELYRVIDTRIAYAIRK